MDSHTQIIGVALVISLVISMIIYEVLSRSPPNWVRSDGIFDDKKGGAFCILIFIVCSVCGCILVSKSHM
jgi:hypothetical protein